MVRVAVSSLEQGISIAIYLPTTQIDNSRLLNRRISFLLNEFGVVPQSLTINSKNMPYTDNSGDL